MLWRLYDMAAPKPPLPVKYFIAILFKEESSLRDARGCFIEQWGPIDFEGKDHLFDITDYYHAEMGSPLFRRIVSFGKLFEPTHIVAMKLACNGIEERMRRDGKRTINCDAGYLDHNKILLASAKEAGQKIYLDKGIYADLAGRYKNGAYQPFEWSFPDFKDGRYNKELSAMRTNYLLQMKTLRQEA
jgi:hypothetical protein